ncbi:MAG: superoxide dismutase [Candidatus Shapirobacteria bacterium]|jgi:Fe-Mn family superoxide dismutase
MKQLTLTSLPYSYDALEPVISKRTVELHHDKHQAAYVNGANTALEKLDKFRKKEIEINSKDWWKNFNFNYNGVRFHELFWEKMGPAKEDNKPSGKVLDAINANFGSWEQLAEEFSGAAITVEGSGWAVLWGNDFGELIVGQIEKHNMLGILGWKAKLVLDVWEHAYYLEYQNNRAEFVKNWWKLVDWEKLEI